MITVLEKTVDDYERKADGSWQLTGRYWREQLHTAELDLGITRQFGEIEDMVRGEHWVKFCEAKIASSFLNKPKREIKEGQVSVAATKEANNIVDVISRYIKLRKFGKGYRGNCPFHTSHTPHNLGVNQEKQVFHCFSCLRGGDVIDFICAMEGLNTKEACSLLSK